MAGTFDISTINVISPNGLVTKPLTVDNYGYAKIGDERVGVTPQNWIINGQFDVWQRGTSFSTNGYSADRWNDISPHISLSITRQPFVVGQIDVPNNPTYFLRHIRTGGPYGILEQRIENVTKLAGKTITLSYWARTSVGTISNIPAVNQYFGTGGSAEASVNCSEVTVTTSWKRFTHTVTIPSVSGKTIGADNSTIIRVIRHISDTGATIDIANVCLVEGSVPVECPNEPYAEVLRKCQRYYWRMSPTLSAFLRFTEYVPAYATTACRVQTMFPVPMRVKPTSMEYSNALYLFDGGTYVAITSITGDQADQYRISMIASVASGLTVYRPYVIQANNSADQYLAFGAEL